jgi:Uma2 family endonuclease
MVRVPDVSFIEAARLAPNRDRSRAFQGVPTLAVEIMSPHDRWSELEEKAALYLSVGTKVVWLIEPEKRRLTVRIPEGSTVLFDEDILEAPEILPGCKISLTELFDD